MSPRPFDHLSAAHERVKAAHQRAAGKGTTPPGGSAILREQLLDAAERLIGERPVSQITTRDIARTAGLSDGVLYNYFANKNDLVVAALLRRFDADLAAFEADLPTPGEGDVEANLVAWAEAWFGLASAVMPTVVGLMSEPDLMHRFLSEIHGEDYGMRRTFGRVAAYLTAEQGLGRLGEFDVQAAVTTLVGSMLALAMSGMVTGRDEGETRERIRGIVRTVLKGIRT
jgi:AcrR family transcriptional regulator